MYTFKQKLPDKKLIYKSAGGINLPMEIYLPHSEINEYTKCYVAIHGGGWQDAIKDNTPWDGGMMKHQARYYASKGNIGIALSYRSLLISDTLTVADILDDVSDAIRFIIRTYPQISVGNMILIGDSAGGHLAAMLGISEDDTIRPYGVICCNPVLNCTLEKWSYGFFGKSDAKCFSPLLQNPKKSSRFLILHGTDDTVTGIGESISFNEKMKAAGHDCCFMQINGGKHAFILYDYLNTDGYVTSIMQKIDEYINLAW